jgi:glycosyltransferase involved in cell wall biosynthesis
MTQPVSACRIAVVVACFNDGATLREALDSVDEPERVEIVVVDDGSDDPQTLRVLSELETEGICIVRQPNSGLSSARMAGIANTTARYVTALDADDRKAAGVLTTLADALDADPTAVVAWGDVQNFGEQRIRDRLGPALDPWLITYVNHLPVSALIRRRALLGAGGWVLRGGYEDWDLWMAFAERGWPGFRLPIVEGYYRVRSTRMLAAAATRHGALFAQMRQRHPGLFADRRANWLRSRAPWRCKLLLPLIDRLPIDVRTRHRVFRAVYRPTAAVKVRLGRLAQVRAPAPATSDN